jgi:hypothetical protein
MTSIRSIFELIARMARRRRSCWSAIIHLVIILRLLAVARVICVARKLDGRRSILKVAVFLQKKVKWLLYYAEGLRCLRLSTI